MERELQVRRRVLSTYNKTRDDFGDLLLYNNYLEEVEDIIFNIIEGIDVEKFETKIATYQRENEEQILASQARKAEEERKASHQTSMQSPIEPFEHSPADDACRMSITPGFGLNASGLQGVRPQPTPIRGLHAADESPASMVDMSPAAVAERSERARVAGGYTTALVERRAREEAFNCL
ncbi:hypothetical protein CYMTET_15424 [Cymbomonas tetramitiformis]|uniref:MAT1 centre domain-containing protein n=1 Tax=Cymbomonas tetramitiformis TaxID=36881 RepID=A0AAE0GE13_9CHLO|nr:hypothetical protein CYMTET_15424 [Cymbomonas tetramitiformis]